MSKALKCDICGKVVEYRISVPVIYGGPHKAPSQEASLIYKYENSPSLCLCGDCYKKYNVFYLDIDTISKDLNVFYTIFPPFFENQQKILPLRVDFHRKVPDIKHYTFNIDDKIWSDEKVYSVFIEEIKYKLIKEFKKEK